MVGAKWHRRFPLATAAVVRRAPRDLSEIGVAVGNESDDAVLPVADQALFQANAIAATAFA